MQENPGQVVTKFDFSGLLSKAWSCTMTPSNITNGFRKCGVYPFDLEAVKPSITSPGVLDESSTDEGSDKDGETTSDAEVKSTLKESLCLQLKRFYSTVSSRDFNRYF